MKPLFLTRPRGRHQSAPILRPQTLTHPLTTAIFGVGLLSSSACCAQSSWEGVDKTVVEKVAEQAGHPARAPHKRAP